MSWVSVISRASTSVSAVDFTKVSGIACWLASTFARAVHRLGRNSATEAVAASTNTNGSRASRRRRRKISTTLARPMPRADSSGRESGVVMRNSSVAEIG